MRLRTIPSSAAIGGTLIGSLLAMGGATPASAQQPYSTCTKSQRGILRGSLVCVITSRAGQSWYPVVLPGSPAPVRAPAASAPPVPPAPAAAGPVAPSPAAPPLPASPPPAPAAPAAPVDISWDVSANSLQFNKKVGQSFAVRCLPAAGARNGSVWGSELYTSDSSICPAGVHAGRITRDVGGILTIEMTVGAEAFGGIDRNGVKTTAYGPYPTAFRFI